MLTDMLITMTDRGPDSAGIAIYGAGDRATAKLTVQSAARRRFSRRWRRRFRRPSDAPCGCPQGHPCRSGNAGRHVDAARAALRETLRPGLRVMSAGDRIEIYKEVGLPRDVADRFSLAG
jgi:glutamate synthase domain-containing protein 1